MVILMVLATLLLLVVFTTQLGDASLALQRVEDAARIKEVNYHVARSAVELAMDLLRVDDIDVDSAQDVWALGNQRLNWEGRDLYLEIRDEDSRFPLAMLPYLKTAEPDRALFTQALERFLTRQGLSGPQAAGALLDWMDLDEDVRSFGSEQGNYPQVMVKNGLPDDLEELTYLQGWGPPQLPPPPPLAPMSDQLGDFQELLGKNANTSGVSTWGDWLSCYSRGKININTAPLEVLASLDPAMSEGTAGEILAYRSTKVIKNQEDLKKIPGIDPDLAFRLNKLVGYTSSMFRVRVTVKSDNVSLELESMLERKSQKEIVVSYWRAR